MAEGDLPPLFEMTAQDRDRFIEDLAQRVFRLGMATPAILFLEANKPLGRLGANTLHLMSPALGVFIPSVDHYGVLFSNPENIDILISRLQEMEHERTAQERQLRQERKARAKARKMKILGFDPDRPEDPAPPDSQERPDQPPER